MGTIDLKLIGILQSITSLDYAIEFGSNEDRSSGKICEIGYEPPESYQNSKKITGNKHGIKIAHADLSYTTPSLG